MNIDFENGYGKPITLALGYFDSVHLGHRELIASAVYEAERENAEPTAFTFKGNLYKAAGADSLELYTFEERVSILKSAGAVNVLYAVPEINFMSYGPREFLDKLTLKFNVRAIVAGSDYRFGAGALGDSDFLKKYCASKGIACTVLDIMEDEGGKISTGRIKALVASGEIKQANKLLYSPYMMIGEVGKGKGNGRIMGFPTANIEPDINKLKLAEGVYATAVWLDGKVYSSITNVGARPTFNDMEYKAESFLIDYPGEPIYGRNIKLYFFDRIRNIVKFDNIEELKLQIKFDLKYSEMVERIIR